MRNQTDNFLDGIQISQLGQTISASYCAVTLAKLGADVIKVESPSGDLLRTMAQGSRNAGMSGKFLNFNRNKRSVCLDIKKKRGVTGPKEINSKRRCVCL